MSFENCAYKRVVWLSKYDPLIDGGYGKTSFVGEIAAALHFKGIITSPTEYESYNWSLMST